MITAPATVQSETPHDANDLVARLWTGALAGLLATAAMTAVMRRGRERLPQRQRYSLPPTELMQALSQDTDAGRLGDKALLAHFAYGALCGGVLTAVRRPRTRAGAGLAGLAIWAVSYLGWAPALSLLRPATEHPWRRNLLMLTSHLAWGLAFLAASRELDAARDAFNARAISWDGRTDRRA